MKNMGKPSVRALILLYIRESIQEKNPISVVIVVEVLARAQIWLNIRESILEKSLLGVVSARRLSVRAPLLFNIV